MFWNCYWGDRSYAVCADQVTFDQARERCQSVGLDLAIIDDEQENLALAKSITSPVFIGLSDAKSESAWRWVADDRLTWCGMDGGRAASASSFTSWANGYPAAARCEAHDYAGRRPSAGVNCNEAGGP
jgi:hypothetical protein